jgi:ATP synthase protein I
MSDETPAREPIGEDARIDALEERLKAAREREDERTGSKVQGADANYRSGNRALADLLGGVLGGLVLGWLFDWLAGTLPWGLLGGLALGIVVAFRNIIRSASKRPDR